MPSNGPAPGGDKPPASPAPPPRNERDPFPYEESIGMTDAEYEARLDREFPSILPRMKVDVPMPKVLAPRHEGVEPPRGVFTPVARGPKWAVFDDGVWQPDDAQRGKILEARIDEWLAEARGRTQPTWGAALLGGMIAGLLFEFVYHVCLYNLR